MSAWLWVAALSLAAAPNGGSGAAFAPEDQALSLDRGPGTPALELQRAEKLTYLVEVSAHVVPVWPDNDHDLQEVLAQRLHRFYFYFVT